MSNLEDDCALKIKQAGLPDPVRQHPVKRPRRIGKTITYHLDFAWPDSMVYLEVQGGTWGVMCQRCKGKGTCWWKPARRWIGCGDCKGTGKRAAAHSGGKGQSKDYEKQNWCAFLGWCGFYLTTDQIDVGWADQMDLIRCAIQLRSEYTIDGPHHCDFKGIHHGFVDVDQMFGKKGKR